MKKALTTIILSAVGLFTSTVSVAQKAHRLTKPNPTQSERQPMRLIPLGNSMGHQEPSTPLLRFGVTLLLMGNGAIILSILKVQGAR